MKQKFQLYAGNRTEDLADRLAELLSEPPCDPFYRETVVVQNRGIATFLQHALGHKLGICCNVDFPFLNRSIDDILCMALSPEDVAQMSIFRPAAMRFSLFATLLQSDGRPSLTAYDAYLNSGNREERARMLASELARTFDQYQIYRPEMMLRGGPAEPAQRHLWRQISNGTGGRSEVFKRFFDLHDAPAVHSRFHRIHVFATGSIPQLYLWFFQKLSEFIPVHFLYLTPCRAEWSTAPGDSSGKNPKSFRLTGTDDDCPEEDETPDDELNVLLSSCGQMGRDLFSAVLEYTDYDPDDPKNCFHEPEKDGATLLHKLQQDILDGVNRAGHPHVDDDDESVCIVDCHHKLREIEILHDELLTRFARHHDWNAGDVMVMAPDIDEYTPYIKAVFESVRKDSPYYIPFQLGDRLSENDDSVQQAFFSLCNIAVGRYTVSEVCSVMENQSVAENFMFDQSDLEAIRILLNNNNVAWGIDDDHRRRLLGTDAPAFAEQSWRRWRDQLMLGFAMRQPLNGSEQLFAGMLPAKAIEGKLADVAMRLEMFLDQLMRLEPLLNTNRTPQEWRQILTDVLETFCGNARNRHAALRNIREAVQTVCSDAASAGIDFPVSVKFMSSEIAQELSLQAHNCNGLLRGGVTFCAMQPMRNIPHRMICLLGMDEASFPRSPVRFGPDLIWRHPRRGDYSARLEDRYFFLESLLSAREVLYISYVGQSVAGSGVIPPSSPVSELTNYLATRFDLSSRRRPLIERHPLHGYSQSYFSGGKLHSWSMDHFKAACKLSERRDASSPTFLNEPVRLQCETETAADDAMTQPVHLYRFFRQPFKWFCKHVLQMHCQYEDSETPDDSENSELDSIQDRHLLAAMLRMELLGQTQDDWIACRRVDGTLPPPPFDMMLLSEQRFKYRALLEKTVTFDDTDEKTTLRRLFAPEKIWTPPAELQFPQIIAAARWPGKTFLFLQNKWNGKTATIDVLFRTRLGENPTEMGISPEERFYWICSDVVKETTLASNTRNREWLESIRRMYLQGQSEPLRFLPEISYKLLKNWKSMNGRGIPPAVISGEMDDFTVRLFIPDDLGNSGELPLWLKNAAVFFGSEEHP